MTKCQQCKKKLGLQEYKCKCEKIFCISHLHAEEHNCTFNYREEAYVQLKKNMEVGPLVQKLEKL
jgi:hypothetical protein